MRTRTRTRTRWGMRFKTRIMTRIKGRRPVGDPFPLKNILSLFVWIRVHSWLDCMRLIPTAALCALVLLCPRASQAAASPYPPSPVITGVTFRDETARTLAPGSDIWPLTWAADGHQYTLFGDGGGFGGDNRDGRVSLGV